MQVIKKVFSFNRTNIFQSLLKKCMFLITLLLMLQLFSVSSYAKEYKEGQKLSLEFELPNSVGKYTISGIYHKTANGYSWEIASTNDLVKREGDFKSTTLFACLCEGYASELGSGNYKDYIIDFFEMLAKGDSSSSWKFVLTSDLVPEENKIVIKNTSPESFEWGKFENEIYYNEILKQGNPGDNVSNGLDENGKSNNPLNCNKEETEPSTIVKKLFINDKQADIYMTDALLFDMLSRCDKLPDLCKDVTSVVADDIIEKDKIVGSDGYTAEIKTTATQMRIVLYNSKNEIATAFLLGNMIGIDELNEIRYTNFNNSKVYITKYIEGNEVLEYWLEHESISSNPDWQCAYYEIGTDGKQETIDKYDWQLSTRENLALDDKNKMYLALRDVPTNDINIYVAKEKNNKRAKLIKILTIKDSEIYKHIKKSYLTIKNQGWIYKLHTNDEIVAYKENSSTTQKQDFYINIRNLKFIYTGTPYFNVFAPVKVGESSMYYTETPSVKEIPFALIYPDLVADKLEGIEELDVFVDEFYNAIDKGEVQAFLDVVALKKPGIQGDTKTKKIKTNDLVYENSENGDFPQYIPINELLMSSYENRENIKKVSETHAIISATLGVDKSHVMKNFAKDLLQYGKAVIMFLVFVAIIYTAIMSIFAGTDIKQRTLIKERVKHIAIGVLIFASTLPIFNLIAGFADETLEELPGIAATYSGSQFYTTALYEENWLVETICVVIDCFTAVINWLIDVILIKAIIPNQDVSIMELVFNVTDASGRASSLLPFTLNEWNTYVYGYKLLSTMAIAIIAIAIVKITGEMFLASGNYEKVVVCKDSYKRMFLAIIGIILAPYGIRMILLFFNYLTGMMPVDASSAKFDIKFEEADFVGAIANFSFATVRLRIYLLFLVRKIMLAFMLIVSPIVLSLWAISAKIRSASLWIGEIFANAALQFCYAMVFWVVMLVTYEGQNPFVTLIFVMLIPKFASFFSSSLQSLGQRWGGVNAEGIADNVLNQTMKVKDFAVGFAQGIGRHTQKISNFFDPKKVSKTGRIINNASNLLTNGVGFVNNLPNGNISGLSSLINGHMTKSELTERQLDVGIENAREEYQLANSEVKYAESAMNGVINDNPNLKEHFEKYRKDLENAHRNGNVEDIIRLGSGYNEVNRYVEAKKNRELTKTKLQAKIHRKENYYKQKSNNIVGKRNAFASLGKEWQKKHGNYDEKVSDIIKDFKEARKNNTSQGVALKKLEDVMKKECNNTYRLEMAVSMYKNVAKAHFAKTGEVDEEIMKKINRYERRLKNQELKRVKELNDEIEYLNNLEKELTSKEASNMQNDDNIEREINNKNYKIDSKKLTNTIIKNTELGSFKEMSNEIEKIQNTKSKVEKVQIAKQLLYKKTEL